MCREKLRSIGANEKLVGQNIVVMAMGLEVRFHQE